MDQSISEMSNLEQVLHHERMLLSTAMEKATEFIQNYSSDKVDGPTRSIRIKESKEFADRVAQKCKDALELSGKPISMFYPYFGSDLVAPLSFQPKTLVTADKRIILGNTSHLSNEAMCEYLGRRSSSGMIMYETEVGLETVALDLVLAGLNKDSVTIEDIYSLPGVPGLSESSSESSPSQADHTVRKLRYCLPSGLEVVHYDVSNFTLGTIPEESEGIHNNALAHILNLMNEREKVLLHKAAMSTSPSYLGGLIPFNAVISDHRDVEPQHISGNFLEVDNVSLTEGLSRVWEGKKWGYADKPENMLLLRAKQQPILNSTPMPSS